MNQWYANLLLDHRWLKKRKEALHRDGYRCQSCEKRSPEVTLCVHHIGYVNGYAPWDYPLNMLQTLCIDCHGNVHAGQKPQFFECHHCHKITSSEQANGRDEKYEWICESCIQKTGKEKM